MVGLEKLFSSETFHSCLNICTVARRWKGTLTRNNQGCINNIINYANKWVNFSIVQTSQSEVKEEWSQQRRITDEKYHEEKRKDREGGRLEVCNVSFLSPVKRVKSVSYESSIKFIRH